MASLFPAPAPSREDPVHAWPTDQVVQYDGPQWWTFSVRGRADVPGSGVAVADGHDGFSRGALDGLAFEPGTDTFRAPEIVRPSKAPWSLPRTVGSG
jgi:hypothetical protein